MVQESGEQIQMVQERGKQIQMVQEKGEQIHPGEWITDADGPGEWWTDPSRQSVQVLVFVTAEGEFCWRGAQLFVEVKTRLQHLVLINHFMDLHNNNNNMNNIILGDQAESQQGQPTGFQSCLSEFVMSESLWCGTAQSPWRWTAESAYVVGAVITTPFFFPLKMARQVPSKRWTSGWLNLFIADSWGSGNVDSGQALYISYMSQIH